MLEKTEINEYLNELKKMQTTLETRLNAIHKDKSKVDGPINPDFQEQAVDLQNNEVIDEIDDIDRQELVLIKKAIVKIENSQFGNCKSCEEPIAPKRLKAVPYAEQCIKCSS